MEIIIESPHFVIEPLLEQQVTKKVNKLAHINNRLLRARVLLKLDKSDTDNNKVCEITVIAPRKNLFAESSHTTFSDAVTEAVSSIERQLRKQKAAYTPGNEKINIPDVASSEEETIA
jgi:putative sigma-54 modulation protein